MAKSNRKIIQFFSALADETRLQILTSLAEKPLTVNAIHSAVGKERMTLSAVSHQLKDLANMEIVSFEKNGREKTFRLSDSFCWCILRDSLKHFNGKSGCKACREIMASNSKHSRC